MKITWVNKIPLYTLDYLRDQFILIKNFNFTLVRADLSSWKTETVITGVFFNHKSMKTQ